MTDERDDAENRTLEDHLSRTFIAGVFVGFVTTMGLALMVATPEGSVVGLGAVIISAGVMFGGMYAGRHYTAQKAETVRQDVDLEREAQAGEVEEIVDEYVEGEIGEHEMERRLGEEIAEIEEEQRELVMER